MGRSALPFGRPGNGPRAEAGKDVTGEFARPGAAPLTVTALVSGIKEALLDAFPATFSVVGEVSNFKRHSSGHLYFSLKDASSAIDAVMFRQAAAGVRFDLADGLEVVATGRVDVWPKAGRLQLYVQRVAPKGAGALELAFRQLRQRLEAEGLFDPARKKPVPRFPRAVGVVTSPTGAAIRDIARTIARRWPAARVFLVGVRVQGDEAPGEIAEAVRLLDAAAKRYEIDTLIVGRGGGSLEDLWAFNEEVVARAIFEAHTPVISGVGHEVDVTIADLVADARAATPTAAAEMAVPDGAELARRVNVLGGRLSRRAGEVLAAARSGLTGILRSAVFRDPSGPVRAARQELDELTTRLRGGLEAARRSREQRLHQAERTLGEHHPRRLLERAEHELARARRDLAWGLGGVARRSADALAARSARLVAAHPRQALRLARQRLAALARQHEAMSYKAVLRRGYSVTRKDGRILRRAGDAAPGDRLRTELADGTVRSQVTGAGRRKRPARRTEDGPTLFDAD